MHHHVSVSEKLIKLLLGIDGFPPWMDYCKSIGGGLRHHHHLCLNLKLESSIKSPNIAKQPQRDTQPHKNEHEDM